MEIIKSNKTTIAKFIKTVLVEKKQKRIPTVPKKELFKVLPYLGTMSSNLKQKLRTCFKNSLPQCNIKIILKSKNLDVIPKELLFHIVYKFSCGNCNVTYYGKTERHFNIRSSDHIGMSHSTGKSVECKPLAVLDYL